MIREAFSKIRVRGADARRGRRESEEKGGRIQNTKRRIVAAALVLCMGAAACGAHQPATDAAGASVALPAGVTDGAGEQAGDEETGAIKGRYEFEENVYVNLLSSFIAIKGYMPHFDITDDALIIVDDDNGTMEFCTGRVERETVTQEDFDALFDEVDGANPLPDLSRFESRVRYAAYRGASVEYLLYLMDDEVWLAKKGGSHVWGVYRLVRAGSVPQSASVGIIGGADGPTAVFVTRGDAEGNEAVCHLLGISGDAVRASMSLRDAETQLAVYGIVAQYETARERTENADLSTAAYYRLIVADGTAYDVFESGEGPRMQMPSDARSQIAVPQDVLDTLYALWDIRAD